MAEQVETVEDRISGLLLEEEGGEPEVKQEPQDESRAEEAEGTPEAEVEANNESEVEKPAETEVEEVDITTFAELAEHEGIPIENLYSLTIPVTGSDGTAKQVSLGEWKDSYQAADLIQAERGRLTNERQVFEQETQQKTQAIERVAFVAQKVLDKQIASYVTDDAKTQELRLTDPAEYAAVKAENKDRIVKAQTDQQEIASEYDQLIQNRKQEMARQMQVQLQQAFQAIPQFIPEWADEKVAQMEKKELVEYGLSENYAQEDLMSLSDPRIVRTLRKAMLFDKQQKAAPEVKKRVVSIGKKVIGSGKSKSKTERKTDERSADYKKFRQGSGSQGELRDAAAFIEKHILGDM